MIVDVSDTGFDEVDSLLFELDFATAINMFEGLEYEQAVNRAKEQMKEVREEF